ncbi:MAG: hypothetical protein ACKOE4_03600, partial [Candidatus Kapaibacterium sp.]
ESRTCGHVWTQSSVQMSVHQTDGFVVTQTSVKMQDHPTGGFVSKKAARRWCVMLARTFFVDQMIGSWDLAWRFTS